jgi:signal transduction histidine kinase
MGNAEVEQKHEDLRGAHAALERRLAEQCRQAERLAGAVESLQDAFAIFDCSDRLVLCNSVYRQLIGDSLGGPILGASYELLSDACSRDMAFSDAAGRAFFCRERLARRRLEPASTTFDMRMRDGRSLRVVDRPTAEGGIVETIWDVTDDVHLADELRGASVAAEAANGAKSEFLSSMSHELRTPLNAVLGFAELLWQDKKEPLSERHRNRVGQILKGAEHVLHLIDDILDLSRIEAGGLSISAEPVNVVEVFDEVTRSLAPMAARQGVLMARDAFAAEPPVVIADRTRLTQILMNFGSNGIKYNRPSGNVMFSVSSIVHGHTRLSVRDTGIGIPSEKQNKLFQPFQRAGQETGPIEGTGIGLVITRRLAHLMNGEVGFLSVEGEGSEFWVDVPCAALRWARIVSSPEDRS